MAVRARWFRNSNFSIREHVSNEPKSCTFYDDGLDNAPETDSQFKTYVPPTNMHNNNLSTDGGLEFLDLLLRTPGHASSLLNVDELQVGMEYSSKKSFLATVKWLTLRMA